MDNTAIFYITIPSTVLTDEKLNPIDKLILGIIYNFTHSRGYCWASNKIIAKNLKISERTVQSSINKLLDLDYIFKWKQKKGKIVYRIITTNDYVMNSKENLKKLIDETKNQSEEVFDYDWLNDNE